MLFLKMNSNYVSDSCYCTTWLKDNIQELILKLFRLVTQITRTDCAIQLEIHMLSNGFTKAYSKNFISQGLIERTINTMTTAGYKSEMTLAIKENIFFSATRISASDKYRRSGKKFKNYFNISCLLINYFNLYQFSMLSKFSLTHFLANSDPWILISMIHLSMI